MFPATQPIDPSDNDTFWHADEYYPATSIALWFTRIGKFNFAGAVPCGSPNTDFTNDTKPDFVLYNTSMHGTAIWYMNNSVLQGGVFGPTLRAGWNVIDVADFNGDFKPDYALFNPSTRQTAMWYLSGATFVGGLYGPTLPSSAWALVAVGDIDGDCSPIMCFINASTHQTVIWYMKNNVLASGDFGPTLPGVWNLVAP